jgi:hypothetical protein
MRTLLACAGLVAAASCSKAERQLDSGRQYRSITYTDTTVESFGRTDRAITGVLIEGLGDSVRFRIHTNPDALVSMVDFTLQAATSRDEPPHTRRIGMPKGTMPLMGSSVAFLEQLLRRARVVGGDSVSIPVMLIGAQVSLDVLTVIRNGSDSVVLVTPSGDLTNALHLAVDSTGRITGGVIPLSKTRIMTSNP